MELPVLGTAARRIGAVDGRRPACLDLLRGGATVLTFPEGAKALAKPLRERYRLCPFGQGFMEVALAARVPIVPVAVVGSEEEMPLVVNARWLARLIRTPVAPLNPTIIVPLPVKYRLHFGTPLHFEGPAGTELVARHVARVSKAVENLLRRGLDSRRHIFWVVLGQRSEEPCGLGAMHRRSLPDATGAGACSVAIRRRIFCGCPARSRKRPNPLLPRGRLSVIAERYARAPSTSTLIGRCRTRPRNRRPACISACRGRG